MNLNRQNRPILQGAGRVLDLCPNSRDRLQRIRPYPNDRAALYRDGTRIGQDLWTVIRREPAPDQKS